MTAICAVRRPHETACRYSVLNSAQEPYAEADEAGETMGAGSAADMSELLAQLPRLPADERIAAVRAAGPTADVLTTLANEVEQLAITQVARALELSEVLIQIADSLGGPRERSRARRAHAQSLAYAGRFDEALPFCHEAESIAAQAGLPVDAAEAQVASIHALVHLGRYDDAYAAGDAARNLFLEAGESVLAARTDRSLGGVCEKRGDPAAALRHFDRARPGLAEDPIALAQLDSNRGLALQSLDGFAAAEDAFRLALPAFEQARMAWASAIVEGNLAVLATRQGRLDQALHFFERARRHLEQDAAPAELARVLAEQADALIVLGVPEQARLQYEQAIPVLGRHGQVREAIQARAGVGRALALLGRSSEAEEHLAEAGRAYHQLGQTAERARLDLIRAEMALAHAAPERARTLATRALQALRARPADAATARHHLARAALNLGDLATAEREVNTAIADAERLRIAPLQADLLHARALLHRAAGRNDDAIRDLRAAVAHVERIRGTLQAERFRAAFHGNRLAVYEDLVRATLDRDDQESASEAFATVERAKSRALLDLVKGMVDTVALDAPSEADAADATLTTELSRRRAELNARYSRLADARLAAGPETIPEKLLSEIATLEQNLEELESRLATSRGAVGLFARPADLAAVRKLLAPDAALIEYFVAGDELLAFVVREGETRVFRHLAHPEHVADRVQRLYFQLRRALRKGAARARQSSRLTQDARHALGALHELVGAPLRGALENVNRLTIVPHGVLHAVPFPALWDGDRHWIESYELRHAPSASLLVHGQSSPAPSSPAEAALVVGVPDEHTPHIEDEARHVAAALGTDRLLLGIDAGVDRFTQAVRGSEIVHIACHGHFSSETPSASGLRLADGWLTLREIYRLGLRARLVTLSGCETGRNIIGAGDELLGLIRGFLAAGAASLVVSLWRVDDESAGKLMTSFYNEFASVRGENGPARALRAAQLELLAERPHPAFWAPFILVGGS